MGRDARNRKLGLVTRQAPPPVRVPKVVIGYPCGGSVTVAFHASLMKLLYHEMRKPEERRLIWEAREGNLARVGFNHCMGLYVADNRNTIARHFLDNSDAEWLLQIDTDIEFPVDLIEVMVGIAIRERIKCLAASVPLGAFETCAFLRTENPVIWKCAPLDRPVIEVDGAATAIMLVHRTVFETIASRHGRSWFNHDYLPNNAGEDPPPAKFEFASMGEDIMFCIRVRESGFGVHVAYVPGLRHHKTRALSHDFELANQQPGDGGVGVLVQEG